MEPFQFAFDSIGEGLRARKCLLATKNIYEPIAHDVD